MAQKVTFTAGLILEPEVRVSADQLEHLDALIGNIGKGLRTILGLKADDHVSVRLAIQPGEVTISRGKWVTMEAF